MSAKKTGRRTTAARRSGTQSPSAASRRESAGILSTAEFMARAHAMESEAAERYAEFADAMEAHNNGGVAELFRKLSRIEQRHADQILEEMGWQHAPAGALAFRWDGAEGPETGDATDLHYLMQPYHALQIALRNERRARDFFADLAETAAPASVRKAAREMRDDEAAHVRLIEEWMQRTPLPEAGWEDDPDPPVLAD